MSIDVYFSVFKQVSRIVKENRYLPDIAASNQLVPCMVDDYWTFVSSVAVSFNRAIGTFTSFTHRDINSLMRSTTAKERAYLKRWFVNKHGMLIVPMLDCQVLSVEWNWDFKQPYTYAMPVINIVSDELTDTQRYHLRAVFGTMPDCQTFDYGPWTWPLQFDSVANNYFIVNPDSNIKGYFSYGKTAVEVWYDTMQDEYKKIYSVDFDLSKGFNGQDSWGPHVSGFLEFYKHYIDMGIFDSIGRFIRVAPYDMDRDGKLIDNAVKATRDIYCEDCEIEVFTEHDCSDIKDFEFSHVSPLKYDEFEDYYANMNLYYEIHSDEIPMSLICQSTSMKPLVENSDRGLPKWQDLVTVDESETPCPLALTRKPLFYDAFNKDISYFSRQLRRYAGEFDYDSDTLMAAIDRAYVSAPHDTKTLIRRFLTDILSYSDVVLGAPPEYLENLVEKTHIPGVDKVLDNGFVYYCGPSANLVPVFLTLYSVGHLYKFEPQLFFRYRSRGTYGYTEPWISDVPLGNIYFRIGRFGQHKLVDYLPRRVNPADLAAVEANNTSVLITADVHFPPTDNFIESYTGVRPRGTYYGVLHKVPRLLSEDRSHVNITMDDLKPIVFDRCGAYTVKSLLGYHYSHHAPFPYFTGDARVDYIYARTDHHVFLYDCRAARKYFSKYLDNDNAKTQPFAGCFYDAIRRFDAMGFRGTPFFAHKQLGDGSIEVTFVYEYAEIVPVRDIMPPYYDQLVEDGSVARSIPMNHLIRDSEIDSECAKLGLNPDEFFCVHESVYTYMNYDVRFERDGIIEHYVAKFDPYCFKSRAYTSLMEYRDKWKDRWRLIHKSVCGDVRVPYLALRDVPADVPWTDNVRDGDDPVTDLGINIELARLALAEEF